MIKRINRTRRRRIEKRHIELSLRTSQNGAAPIFDLRLQLAGYGFPPDARVRVESWRGNAVQRWDYGTVGTLMPPSDEERRLTEVPAGAQFRICIVSSEGSGRLLGHAPNIRPVLPLGSLLPLQESDDLGDEVWRVDFGDGGDLAVLLVNRKVPGISEIVRSDPAFRALVMPQVLRTILTRVVLVDRADAEDEGAAADWLALARVYHPDEKGEPPSLRPVAPLEEVEQAREWIEDVVAAFAAVAVKAAPTYAEAQA